MNNRLKLRIFLLSIIIVIVVFSIATKEKSKEIANVIPESKSNTTAIKKIKIVLEQKNNSGAIGTVNFVDRDGQVYLTARLEKLSEGEHAIHIHEKADCSSFDGKSTGGHWNPTFKKHGKWGDPNGYNRGDIGNFTVGKDEIGEVSFATDEWCIGCDDETKNIVGKAVIIHDGKDDFVSQPAGNAGKRILCGAIIQ